METIFTWVATTSGTDIHARHSGHTGPFGRSQLDTYASTLSYPQMNNKSLIFWKNNQRFSLLLVQRTLAVKLLSFVLSFFYYIQFNFSVDSFSNFFVMLGTWQKLRHLKSTLHMFAWRDSHLLMSTLIFTDSTSESFLSPRLNSWDILM